MSVDNSALISRAYAFVQDWKSVQENKNFKIPEQQYGREFLNAFYDVFGISKNNYRQSALMLDLRTDFLLPCKLIA